MKKRKISSFSQPQSTERRFIKMNKTLITLISIFTIVALVSSVTFPRPFNEGQNGTAIVIGSQADMDAARMIRDFLMDEANNVTDSFQFSRGTNRLNLGESLTDLQAGVINHRQMPNILAQGEYVSFRGDTFNYNQEITLSDDLVLRAFRDNDYRDGDPSIGIYVRNRQHILNYTIDFRDRITTNIIDGRLTDMEDTEIEILGREYRIVTARPGSIDMIYGAAEGSIQLGENRTFVVDGQRFDVESVFISQNSARFRINGELTRALNEGQTQTIRGTTIAVTQIDYQDFAGGIQRTHFLLGASTLNLRDGQEVQVDRENVQGLTVQFDSQTNANQYTLRRINFVWRADRDLFIAENVPVNRQVMMPALQNLSIIMTEFVRPEREELLINPTGRNVMSLEVFVRGGNNDSFELPILYSEGQVFTAIGGRPQERLVTSRGNSVVWNNDLDEYLVVSWNDVNNAESYILRPDVGTDRGESVVSFRNLVTNVVDESNIRVGGTARFGDILLTVQSIDQNNQTAVISANQGSSFDRLYTQEGLMIILPVAEAGPGSINLNSSTNWVLNMTEEDDNNNIGQGRSFGISIIVNPATEEVEVGTVQNPGQVLSGGILASLRNNPDISVGWVNSSIASEIRIDAGTRQTSATVIYPGGESYARVFLTTGAMNRTNNRTIEIVFADQINDTNGMNIISVGGTCVNNMTARILDVQYPLCGDAWENQTGVGPNQFLIETFRSPFEGNGIATVVAGYEREDTLQAAEHLIEENIDITEGNRIIV
jgi:hypothetical protein